MIHVYLIRRKFTSHLKQSTRVIIKIAIFSDSHDRIENLQKAIDLIAEEADMLIHCGDYCAPFMLNELSRFKGEIHGVFGNVDGDIYLMMKFASEIPNLELHHPVGEISPEGKKIAFVHYPPLACGLAATSSYDAVFYGHTHQFKNQKVGRTLLVNAGEIMGKNSAPSFVIYDTASHRIEQRLVKP